VSSAFIAIGSNLGQRKRYCDLAVEYLQRDPKVDVVAQSAWHEYPALTRDPDEQQPDFLNGVIAVQTDLLPPELLSLCHRVEDDLGRKRPTRRWAPRTIDLDILFFDELTIKSAELTLPHPELHKRRFVLEPMAEIMPDWVHPVLGKTIAELKERERANNSQSAVGKPRATEYTSAMTDKMKD
jgi:2-amino-4-hydroxy-6-hydroxymethyldihydropteridine diphosphokinase